VTAVRWCGEPQADLPPALAARATGRETVSEVAVAPARSWKPAPGPAGRVIRALVIVTGRPMSRSKPVPGLRLPKVAVVYQSVCQAVVGLASMAKGASRLFSPWPLP
jgi:hypothetical protein